MNSIYEMQITGSWWRHYPIQNVILNSEIWWKTQFFDKNDFFHRSSEQISTFIHRNAKLTLGRNMVATGHVTAVAKMNPSYLSGGANVHSFHHLSEQISLSSRIWCEFSRIFPIFFQKIITKKIKLRGGNPHSVVSQCLVDISGYIKHWYLRYNVVR